MVHKTLDYELNESLDMFLDEHYKLIPLHITLQLLVGHAVSLQASTPFTQVELRSEFIVEKAQKSPQTKEQILDQFNAFGNTYYQVESIEIESDYEGFIPNSILKNLRRDLIARLEEQMVQRESTIIPSTSNPTFYYGQPQIIVKVETTEQFEVAKQLGITEIYYGKNVVIPQLQDTYYYYMDRIHSNQELSLDRVVVHDIGLLHKYPDKQLIGSNFLNITNHLSLAVLKAKRATVSPELTIEQVLSLKSPIPLECIVYDRPDVMITKYCPITKSEGLYKENCHLCEHFEYALEDGKEKRLPIKRDHKCNVRILHHSIVEKPEWVRRLVKRDISIRINFTIESKQETKRVLHKYLELFHKYQ